MTRLTVKDLEQFQAEHPDHQMELVEGEIIVMSPSGLQSDEVAAEIVRLLGNWVRPRKLGRVAAILQDGDILTVPDVLPGWELPVSEIWAPAFE